MEESLQELEEIVHALAGVARVLTDGLERIERGDFNHPEHARNIARLSLRDARTMAGERLPVQVMEAARRYEQEKNCGCPLCRYQPPYPPGFHHADDCPTRGGSR